MRYTTVIDISDDEQLYRNRNAVLVYLHLSLKAGYHDDDRDICRISIRNLAWQLGITVSAARHALRVLTDRQLLTKEGDAWRVKKWHLEAAPSPRPRKSQARGAAEARSIRDQYDKEVAEYRQRLQAAIRSSSREELTQWLQELHDGRRIMHHGAYINPNPANAEWLKKVIDSL